MSEQTGQFERFSFRGEGGSLFKIYLVNMILTVVTLGIYNFWARVNIAKYLYQNTYLFNENFDYHATGQELFIGFLKGVGIMILVIIGYLMISWVLVQIMGDAAQFVLMLLFYGGIIGVAPFLIVGSYRFHLARTSYRNIRFAFTATGKDLQKEFYIGVLLSIITLGIYSPWFIVKMRTFFTDNSNYGNEAFSFKGDGGELLKIYLVGILLTIVTLGIYGSWLQADLIRYFAERTTIQGKRFNSNITGGQIFVTTLVAMLMIMFSLGIAFPWAIVKLEKLFLESTGIEPGVDFARIEARKDSGASSLSDGISDAADALLG